MQKKTAGSDFASVIGLGAFVSEHKPSRTGQLINLLFGVGMALASPAVCAMGLWMGWDAYDRRGLNRVVDSGFFLPLLCAIILLPLGGYLAWQVFRNWGINLALYEGGFAHKDRSGLKPVSWNDIEAVWQNITRHYRYGVHTGTTYQYTVQLNDKSRLTLDNKFPRIEAIGKAITNGSANTLFPKYAAAVNAGQRVTFGPLGLDRNGMYTGNKSLAWQDIKAVKISQGIISIKKEGGWFNWTSVSVPQVPNFWVFLELVSRFTKVE